MHSSDNMFGGYIANLLPIAHRLDAVLSIGWHSKTDNVYGGVYTKTQRKYNIRIQVLCQGAHTRVCRRERRLRADT